MIAMKRLFFEKFVINEITKYQCQFNYMEPLCKGVKFKSKGTFNVIYNCSG